ncbi:MAG TPA: hypothetical protein VJ986_00610, partial [Gaiellaceae bacterium]|nr:hypothetical protein [Gaiellaceae bacterium]
MRSTIRSAALAATFVLAILAYSGVASAAPPGHSGGAAGHGAGSAAPPQHDVGPAGKDGGSGPGANAPPGPGGGP